MWSLQTPWYELVFRGTCIYFFVFLIMRIWGRKHIGELTTFDFILLLIMSEALQNSMVEDDKSLTGGMIVLSTFLGLNALVNRLTYRFPMLEVRLNGNPIVLVKQGQLMKEDLEKQKITMKELLQALRLEGVLKVEDVEQATLEANGHISVVKRA